MAIEYELQKFDYICQLNQTDKVMKKVLVLLIWAAFTNSSDRSDWYIPVHHEDNVTTLVPRDEYLSYKELFEYKDERLIVERLNHSSYINYGNCKYCGKSLHNKDNPCNECKLKAIKDYWKWERELR